MKCPKCEQGIIKKTILKHTNEKATICTYCGTLWFANEEIHMHSGHPFAVTTQGNAVEYVLENTEEQDQEHRSAEYTKYK